MYLIVNFKPANIFYHVTLNPLRPGEVWWVKLNTNFHCNFIAKIPLYQKKFWLSIISMALWAYKLALVQQISGSTFCQFLPYLPADTMFLPAKSTLCQFLPAKSQPWYSMSILSSAPVLTTDMASTRLRIIYLITEHLLLHQYFLYFWGANINDLMVMI